MDTPTGATAKPRVVTTSAVLQSIPVGCSAVEAAEPQVLGVTYEFDAPASGDPFPLTIRFFGRRRGVVGEPGPRDAFDVTETIASVVPGSGRVTLSKRVGGINAGEWGVVAAGVPAATLGTAARPLPSLVTVVGSTGWGPAVRVRAPGVRVGAWPALVVLGAVVAVTTQLLLLALLDLPVWPVLVLSAIACLVGVAGAKLYYLAEHRGRPQTVATSGMCIQGFVLAAVATVVLGALVLDVPIGLLLDATAPGLLFGMAIGRLGCLLGGCCAGRPSRWGLWSSDRRLGVRRIPTQLFESAGALLIGLTALWCVAVLMPRPAGVVFAGALAAYTLGRQFLFPLRDLPRNTSYGRTVTAVLSALVLAGSVVAAVLL